jgi:hypothetical protein
MYQRGVWPAYYYDPLIVEREEERSRPNYAMTLLNALPKTADNPLLELLGGAPNSGAFSGSGLGGWAGSLGTPLAYAALIGAGKAVEHNNPDSWIGRALLSGLGPSIAQIKEDPKLGLTTALGLPFLNGWIRSDEAAREEPEWFRLLGF